MRTGSRPLTAQERAHLKGLSDQVFPVADERQDRRFLGGCAVLIFVLVLGALVGRLILRGAWSIDHFVWILPTAGLVAAWVWLSPTFRPDPRQEAERRAEFERFVQQVKEDLALGLVDLVSWDFTDAIAYRTHVKGPMRFWTLYLLHDREGGVLASYSPVDDSGHPAPPRRRLDIIRARNSQVVLAERWSGEAFPTIRARRARDILPSHLDEIAMPWEDVEQRFGT